MFFQEADNFHYESTILTMMAMVLISCLNHIAYTYNLLLLLIVRMHVCICSGRNAFASSCCCFEIEMGELASVSTIYCCISGDFNFYLSLIEHKIMHMFISFWYQSQYIPRRWKIILYFIDQQFFDSFRRHRYTCEWNFSSGFVAAAAMLCAICFYLSFFFLLSLHFGSFLHSSIHFSHILILVFTIDVYFRPVIIGRRVQFA